MSMYKEEIEALEKSQRATQRLINRMEHEEWIRVKKKHTQAVETDLREHIEYNKLVDSHFENLQAKQKKLQKLQELKDREEEARALKEAKRELRQTTNQRDQDDLRRSGEKSKYLAAVRRQALEARQQVKRENAQQKIEFYKLRRRHSTQTQDREVKENLHSRSLSALNELKAARAKSQSCLRELQHIQKLLNKADD